MFLKIVFTSLAFSFLSIIFLIEWYIYRREEMARRARREEIIFLQSFLYLDQQINVDRKVNWKKEGF